MLVKYSPTSSTMEIWRTGRVPSISSNWTVLRPSVWGTPVLRAISRRYFYALPPLFVGDERVDVARREARNRKGLVDDSVGDCREYRGFSGGASPDLAMRTHSGLGGRRDPLRVKMSSTFGETSRSRGSLSRFRLNITVSDLW